MESTIIFVADKGFFNTLIDSAHKLLSPKANNLRVNYLK